MGAEALEEERAGTDPRAQPVATGSRTATARTRRLELVADRVHPNLVASRQSGRAEATGSGAAASTSRSTTTEATGEAMPQKGACIAAKHPG